MITINSWVLTDWPLVQSVAEHNMRIYAEIFAGREYGTISVYERAWFAAVSEIAVAEALGYEKDFFAPPDKEGDGGVDFVTPRGLTVAVRYTRRQKPPIGFMPGTYELKTDLGILCQEGRGSVYGSRPNLGPISREVVFLGGCSRSMFNHLAEADGRSQKGRRLDSKYLKPIIRRGS